MYVRNNLVLWRLIVDVMSEMNKDREVQTHSKQMKLQYMGRIVHGDKFNIKFGRSLSYKEKLKIEGSHSEDTYPDCEI